ncbi:MAG TPA: hypothetical protein ENN09_06325 [Planctomycetes bacterium]|nr:hypothetical protein [Planctomycetota bacterium]
MTLNIAENAELARKALRMEPTDGIPQKALNVMDIPLLEEIAGAAPGDYRRDPVSVYLDFQRAAGTCFIDQFIPENPLTMSSEGYTPDTKRTATTGAAAIELDGIRVDSPEAVVEHMERFAFPELAKAAAETPSPQKLVEKEASAQDLFGPDILKVPYDGFQAFPRFRYGQYGYADYFMAYALYPDVIEKDFRLQADAAIPRNAAAAAAIIDGGLPPVVRLDHDMTDSRGTLVDVKSLDSIWFPHFARAVRPLLDAGVRLLWHCDGNVSPMVPRLIEAGVSGFQGFQYEDGVDYPAICRMKAKDGGALMVWAGVSVTRTLPHGSKDDVKRELAWLVENGPRVGMVLGASSSIVPGAKRENVRTLVEGLKHYRTKGRAGG